MTIAESVRDQGPDRETGIEIQKGTDIDTDLTIDHNARLKDEVVDAHDQKASWPDMISLVITDLRDLAQDRHADQVHIGHACIGIYD